jgi:hypothetical protein
VVLVAGALALAFAVSVGPQVVGALSAMTAPPPPPLPVGVVQITHENLAHGVDNWTYDIEQDVCQLVTFYQDQGGECPVLPPHCTQTGESSPADRDAAICTGDVQFSIFAMRWQMSVPRDTIMTDAETRFRLSRVVSWSGSPSP